MTNLPTGCAWDIATLERSRLKQFAEALEPQPGETIDLGEIDISSDKRPAIKRSVVMFPAATGEPAPPEKVSGAAENMPSHDRSAAGRAGVGTAGANHAAAAPAAEKSRLLRGRVIGPNGQPVAGADVAVIAARVTQKPGGFIDVHGEIPAEGKTDEQGQFTFSFPALSSKTHREAHVIARGTGLGMGYAKFKPDDGQLDVELKLQPEEPLRCRIVDVDGQPGADVRMSIHAIMPRSGDERWKDAVAFMQAETYPAAWPTLSPTDADGRFEIHGAPSGHGIYLQVPGTEQFAPQYVMLNSGQPEERGEHDATYRALVKNGRPGQETVLPLAPAQWFEGTVRYADTGEPAPHAKVSIWASQQRFGSMSSVHGETDDQGRYRINPNSGIRFGIHAFGPAHTPYLNYQTPREQAIDWQSGERIRKVDVTLPRGVIVRGTIVDANSGEPITGASVQYIPESENNPNVADTILTGWQNMQASDDAGRFEIVVLPGPGRLLVHGPDGSYILREIGSRELYRSKRGGERNYAHGIEKVDPQPNQEPLEVKISLERRRHDTWPDRRRTGPARRGRARREWLEHSSVLAGLERPIRTDAGKPV